MANTSKREAITAWIVAIAMAAYGGYWLAGAHQERVQTRARIAAQTVARNTGPLANVVETVELGPGQTLRLVQVHTGLSNDGSMDPRCLIFTDAATHSSAITCPDADSLDFSNPGN